jgi:hypothetical protein
LGLKGKALSAEYQALTPSIADLVQCFARETVCSESVTEQNDGARFREIGWKQGTKRLGQHTEEVLTSGKFMDG